MKFPGYQRTIALIILALSLALLPLASPALPVKATVSWTNEGDETFAAPPGSPGPGGCPDPPDPPGWRDDRPPILLPAGRSGR